jgi:hypothetical protein
MKKNLPSWQGKIEKAIFIKEKNKETEYGVTMSGRESLIKVIQGPGEISLVSHLSFSSPLQHEW